ncbi:sensor domain-containing diguanylate cyclase [Chitinimonas sp.]|uniref:sensor domain-containing diguanylate cyclase n=1 Tax=Chitinimonas sp. TaxID=1934313 RepID=UPI002F959979
MYLELYADDADLVSLEARIADPGGAAPLAQVGLAWHLRQRDSRRALTLAAEAVARLEQDPADQTALLARIALLRAEVEILFTRFDAAAGLIETARTGFVRQEDLLGTGDCHLTAALLANARGDGEGSLAEAQAARDCYGKTSDHARCQIAAAWTVHAATYLDPGSGPGAVKALQAEFPELVPPAQVILGMAEAFNQFNAGQYAYAAVYLAKLIGVSERMGMIHWRIRIGNTLSAAFANLDDKESALPWVEQTLALARASHWPVALGETLALLGSLVHAVGQTERSISLLSEAVDWLRAVPESRSMATANCYLSQVKLAAGRPAEALQHALTAEQIGGRLAAHAVVADARILAGRACAALGEGERARQLVEAGLALTEQHNLPFWQVDALQALAEIDGAFPLPGRSALPHLERAVEVVNAMGGHSESVALLQALSRAHEQAGDLARALDYARQAHAKADKAEHRRVANQLVALELRHQSEQQRIEAEHQRTLAETQLVRARELETSMQVLENLGRIGRDITANLDIGSVLQSLVAHLGQLMQVTYVGMSLLEPNGRELLRRGVENGIAMPDRKVPLDSPTSVAARCARERQEILVEHQPGHPAASHIPGTQQVLASWFGPLLVGEELLGVLTVQSAIEHAYGAREQLIFRTLSAHVAVAVANARAYAKLGEQHTRLLKVEAEMRKLATTDSLTGIPNRRHFLAALASEAKRSQRSGRPVAVIMADIDHFKSVNDTLGHPAGDAVLVHVARLLDHNRRSADTVGRLGGEEFALLLPEADADSAAEVADRLRRVIEASPVNWQGNRVPVTMSFGCASLRGDLATQAVEQIATELLQSADRALYQAKHTGRNRTALSRDGKSELYPVEPA